MLLAGCVLFRFHQKLLPLLADGHHTKRLEVLQELAPFLVNVVGHRRRPERAKRLKYSTKVQLTSIAFPVPEDT